MEEYAYITPVLASVFYLLAGVRLLGLHRRTRERPELLLSTSFTLAGVYYFSYNAPSLFRLDPWTLTIEWLVEWIYILSVFPFVFFIRTVFRPSGAWAGALVVNCSVFLIVGTAMGGIDGQIVYSLNNPWFMIQWVGYTTPGLWLCCEATLSRLGAKKRARLGLSQPIVVNRYLLLAILGGLQTLACLSDLSFARDISSNHTVSTVSNLLLGGTEIASVAVLWVAFFPPTFYANWIARRAETILTPVEG
jgi:hypothetical protein